MSDKAKDQLSVYARLVEERTGKKVSKMSIYYTTEKKNNKITIPYVEKDIDKTMKSFDDTVKKIMNKDFSVTAIDLADGNINNNTCNNCDFRKYCSATVKKCRHKKK